MAVSLSVIVPVYNVEKYLRQCLDSIRNQSWTDYEVILIDDGSTDDSLSICREYVAVDDRFRVFHQENAGLSSARNHGVRQATGTWLCFVDSDDIVPNDAFECMLNCATDTTDVIMGRLSFFFDGDTDSIKQTADDFSDVIASKGNNGLHLDDIIEHVRVPLWSSCRNYVRRDFWQTNDFAFAVGITSEDLQLLPRVQMAARNIAVCNASIYLYRQARQNSIMTARNVRRELQYCDVVSFYKQFFADNPCYESVRSGLMQQMGEIAFGNLSRARQYDKSDRKRLIARLLEHKDIILDCKYAKKWKILSKVIGTRAVFALIGIKNSGV